MSSKNNISALIPQKKISKPQIAGGYSLRLQMMLWYGSLIAFSLGIFAILVLVLSTDAIDKNVNDVLAAETRVAKISVEKELQPTAPYWPTKAFALTTVDIYRDPGVAIEITDIQDKLLYRSNSDAENIPISAEQLRRLTNKEQPLLLYNTAIQGENIRVQATPIYAPSNEQPVGILLVAKSLEDAQRSITLLRTLLLLCTLAALTVALLGGWAITANILHPLTQVVQTARTIASHAHGAHVGALRQRVQRPRGHDEMVQVVDTFNEMLDALESAALAQKRFVADASHELRAPLTTIQGNLAFLQRYSDQLPEEERRTMLSDAHGETLRLARLVEELLILARADMEAEKESSPTQEGQVLDKQPKVAVELDHVLLQLVRQMRGRLKGEGTNIKLEVGHIEPARVYSDEETLRRILLILLDNAFKYTPEAEDGKPGRVTVSMERNGKEVTVQVSDTGIGIDPVDLPHIFERFYRADRARSRQGTGLGLAIAKTLLEQEGGSIEAESVASKGSTFRIHLPIAS